MNSHWIRVCTPVLLLAAAGCDSGDSGFHDIDASHNQSDSSMSPDTPTSSCVDTDNDGIEDRLEQMPQPGVPGGGDSDMDGFTDEVEAAGNYPGFLMHPALTCGQTPADCDNDHIANFRDIDSDNDGLTDAEELAARSDPCNEDTDNDGVGDLIEHVAGTDPADPSSQPPASTLYLTLPYHAPGEAGDHVHQQFDFSTHIHRADVFFLVDNSASMDSVIANLRNNLSTTIVPGIRAAIPDVHIGVGSFDSMPDGSDGESGSPGDYTLWVRQKVAADAMLSQMAFNNMQTISNDAPGHYGGDGPEDSTEALFESIQGDGSRTHETDAAAARSVHNAADPTGDGWVSRMDPVRDCGMGPDDPIPYGWACFGAGRVPILVLASDADWYDGYAAGSPHSAYGHNSTDLTTAMTAAGAFFIGIDVGFGMSTYNNAVPLAMATNTVDAHHNPIAFNVGGNIGMAATAIVDAITTIAGSTRQDITTRADSDPMETRVMAPHTTADFIKAITPTYGEPDAPAGYDRLDATTFYNVDPATRVFFDADFYNDFQPGAPTTATLFRAKIIVLGRARAEVDSRDVYIVVPAAGAGVPM